MTSDNLQVANTILAQLGGNRFLAMTGATKLVGSANSLTFAIPNSRKVVVTLDPSDTYTLAVWRIRGYKDGATSTVSTYPQGETSGVYCDQLQKVFTSLTGLDTRL